jgi:translation elongation factor EF-1alpha
MDTNAEERAKGKTVEVGRASFTTGKKVSHVTAHVPPPGD